MNPDHEGEIRARLRGVALPAAPEGLVERVRLVASRPATRTSAVSGPRGRLLIPLAAVLVIAAAAVWAGGGGPPSRDPNAGSQGPSVATFVVEALVNEPCGPIGCAFHVELRGPGGPWRGVLDYAELGVVRDVTPSLPETLGTGSYVLQASIHVISDAIEPGQVEGRDLGTTATCSADFVVTADAQAVTADLGFWLDRCSVGAVAAAGPGSLAAFDLGTTFAGACGAVGGCEYRVVLSGPSGSWQAALRSPKPASQLAIGPDLPAKLAPDFYRLEASSHPMSEEVAPGAGHQRELGVAATCSADFLVASDSDRVGAAVTYDGETCSVSVETTVRAPEASGSPPDASPIDGPFASPQVTCEPGSTDLPGLDCATEITCFFGEPASTCEQYIDAALEALGPGQPPIKEIVVHRICAAPYPEPIPPCGTLIVQVTFPARGGFEPAELTVSFSITPGPDGPVATLLGSNSSQEPQPRERWFGPDYPAQPPEGLGWAISRAELRDDGRTLTVEFVDSCFIRYYEPWVGRSGNALLVSIVAGPYVPMPSGVACVLVAYTNTYHLALPEPFTGSTVRDLNNGMILFLD